MSTPGDPDSAGRAFDRIGRAFPAAPELLTVCLSAQAYMFERGCNPAYALEAPQARRRVNVHAQQLKSGTAECSLVVNGTGQIVTINQ